MRSDHVLAALGNIILVTAAAMVIPLAFSFALSDGMVPAFLWAILIASVVGFAMRTLGDQKTDLTTGEGCAIVSGAWVSCSLFGAIPYTLSEVGVSYTDAYFETMSGFTTTGATILSNLESMPKSLLLWRALTQWMGGMGIVVLMLAIFPMLGSAAFKMYKAEVPGPTSDRLRPKIKDSAKMLWYVYLLFTVVQFLLLLPKIGWFDALCISFSTLSTGGFAPSDASAAYWQSAYVDYVIILFMFFGGCNFMLHFHWLKGNFRPLKKNIEFKSYCWIVLIASLAITMVLTLGEQARHPELGEAFRHALFQVVSIMTTSGFCTDDFDLWPPFAKYLLVVLMTVGACAGSTSGSIKLIRFIICVKGMLIEVRRTLFPNLISPIKVSDEPVESNTVRNIIFFFFLYFMVFFVGSLVMTLEGWDLVTAATATIACLSNIGPGLGEVGPAKNFAEISVFGKWFLSFMMLIGRLEIYSFLILFMPRTWQR